ncbi:hypothetical protein P9875_20480 [Janthinobacterium rivuli]|uniref:Flagellar hook-length control protein n=1 Tax=Janthinobacterium rivuli TaxID=2751478 RepID=A0ABY8I1R1_9BURK|nr:hypothetical protein [Janthinobacterium rivuli]WFR78068.1 hypothetical protein P9875_20480 [Janthinobacterium rivuli]
MRLLQALLGLCALLAVWPLSGVWRSLPAPGQLVGGYALGLFAALLSAAGGVFLLALLRWRRKPQALDISPVGQLRLAVYLEHGGVPGTGVAGVAEPAEAAPGLRLLPGSTLWSSLLVLCLADAAGRRTEVLVQRGGSCAAFRPLAVACRAIAARNREE